MPGALRLGTFLHINTSMLSTSNCSSSVMSPKPTVSGGKLARGGNALFGRLGNIFLNASLGSSLIKASKRRGVHICEERNDVFEISTRADRVERGDLELFYPDDWVPDPVIECCVCRYEAENDPEAGAFRIFNLPDGGWQLLCPKCNPPDPAWEFDRTVAVIDALLPPDLLQQVFLFLGDADSQVCAQVCRTWNDLSWTVLTLLGDGYYTKKLRCDKMRNVWVLRVYLHDVATADAYCNELSDNLYQVDGLIELQLTGVAGDKAICRLAQALRPHRLLQVVDLGACEFSNKALTALLSAMEDNEAASLELTLPRCCMDTDGHRFSSAAAARQALQAVVSGTHIVAQLV
eukprot:EG_transcript_13206